MMKTRFSPTLRLIACIVVQAFVIEQAAFAAPDRLVNGLTGKRVNGSPEINFKLPNSIGFIEDSYQSPAHPLTRSPVYPKTIILVQDAHTNESGQINVARALETVLKSEGIRYVFLEAGYGDASLSYLRSKAPLEARKEIALGYLRKGLLQGSEYLDMTSDLDFKLWGVEDPFLYEKALGSYRAIVKNRERFKDYLNKVQSTAEFLRPKVYNPALKAFDDLRESYLANETPLTAYFEALAREARKAKVPLSGFPALKAFDGVRKRESRIDFKKAAEEQERAVEGLGPGDREALLKMAAKDRSPLRVPLEMPREARAFYALLEEKLADSVERTAKRYTPSRKYPELFKYLDYLKGAAKIDARLVLREQKVLEDAVYAALIRSREEADLRDAARGIRQLKGFLDLAVSPDEFSVYRLNPSKFDVVTIAGFLNRKIMELGSYREKTVFLEPEFKDALKKCEEFYKLTTERDLALVENMFRVMDEQKEAKAVLIAGGYHSPNLKELLKRRNASYVCVTPQVLHPTDQKRYEKLLLGQKTSDAENGKNVIASKEAMMVRQARFQSYLQEIETTVEKAALASRAAPRRSRTPRVAGARARTADLKALRLEAREEMRSAEMIINHFPSEGADEYAQIDALLSALYGGEVFYYGVHKELRKGRRWERHHYRMERGLLNLLTHAELQKNRVLLLPPDYPSFKVPGKKRGEEELLTPGEVHRIVALVESARKRLGQLGVQEKNFMTLKLDPKYQNPFLHTFLGKSELTRHVSTAESRLEKAVDVGDFSREDEAYLRRFQDVFQPALAPPIASQIVGRDFKPFLLRVVHNTARGPGKGGMRYVTARFLWADDVFVAVFDELKKRMNLRELRYFLRKWIREETLALAVGMTIKDADLPYGGAKGAFLLADVYEERGGFAIRDYAAVLGPPAQRRLLDSLDRSFVQAMFEAGKVGPHEDVPATDVGSGPRDMDIMADEYLALHIKRARQTGEFQKYPADLRDVLNGLKHDGKQGYIDLAGTPALDAVAGYFTGLRRASEKIQPGTPLAGLAAAMATFTSKSLERGGSHFRPESTGFGAHHVFKAGVELEGLKDELKRDPTAKIEGLGGAGFQTALSAVRDKLQLQAVAEISGVVYSEKGFSEKDLLTLRGLIRSAPNGLADLNRTSEFTIPGTKLITKDEFLALGTFVTYLAAKENSITRRNVLKLNTRVVVEVANGPVTNNAYDELMKRGVRVIPDSIANAGGVTVSYFEWEQNQLNEQWPEALVVQKLVGSLTDSVLRVHRVVKEKNTDWRTATDIHAFGEVLRARDLQAGSRVTQLQELWEKRKGGYTATELGALNGILGGMIGDLGEAARKEFEALRIPRRLILGSAGSFVDTEAYRRTIEALDGVVRKEESKNRLEEWFWALKVGVNIMDDLAHAASTLEEKNRFYERGFALGKAAVGIVGDDPELLRNYAMLLVHTRRLEEAEALYDRILASPDARRDDLVGVAKLQRSFAQRLFWEYRDALQKRQIQQALMLRGTAFDQLSKAGLNLRRVIGPHRRDPKRTQGIAEAYTEMASSDRLRGEFDLLAASHGVPLKGYDFALAALAHMTRALQYCNRALEVPVIHFVSAGHTVGTLETTLKKTLNVLRVLDNRRIDPAQSGDYGRRLGSLEAQVNAGQGMPNDKVAADTRRILETIQSIRDSLRSAEESEASIITAMKYVAQEEYTGAEAAAGFFADVETYVADTQPTDRMQAAAGQVLRHVRSRMPPDWDEVDLAVLNAWAVSTDIGEITRAVQTRFPAVKWADILARRDNGRYAALRLEFTGIQESESPPREVEISYVREFGGYSVQNITDALENDRTGLDKAEALYQTLAPWPVLREKRRLQMARAREGLAEEVAAFEKAAGLYRRSKKERKQSTVDWNALRAELKKMREGMDHLPQKEIEKSVRAGRPVQGYLPRLRYFQALVEDEKEEAARHIRKRAETVERTYAGQADSFKRLFGFPSLDRSVQRLREIAREMTLIAQSGSENYLSYEAFDELSNEAEQIRNELLHLEEHAKAFADGRNSLRQLREKIEMLRPVAPASLMRDFEGGAAELEERFGNAPFRKGEGSIPSRVEAIADDAAVLAASAVTALDELKHLAKFDRALEVILRYKFNAHHGAFLPPAGHVSDPEEDGAASSIEALGRKIRDLNAGDLTLDNINAFLQRWNEALPEVSAEFKRIHEALERIRTRKSDRIRSELESLRNMLVWLRSAIAENLYTHDASEPAPEHVRRMEEAFGRLLETWDALLPSIGSEDVQSIARLQIANLNAWLDFEGEFYRFVFRELIGTKIPLVRHANTVIEKSNQKMGGYRRVLSLTAYVKVDDFGYPEDSRIALFDDVAADERASEEDRNAHLLKEESRKMNEELRKSKYLFDERLTEAWRNFAGLGPIPFVDALHAMKGAYNLYLSMAIKNVNTPIVDFKTALEAVYTSPHLDAALDQLPRNPRPPGEYFSMVYMGVPRRTDAMKAQTVRFIRGWADRAVPDRAAESWPPEVRQKLEDNILSQIPLMLEANSLLHGARLAEGTPVEGARGGSHESSVVSREGSTHDPRPTTDKPAGSFVERLRVFIALLGLTPAFAMTQPAEAGVPPRTFVIETRSEAGGLEASLDLYDGEKVFPTGEKILLTASDIVQARRPLAGSRAPSEETVTLQDYQVTQAETLNQDVMGMLAENSEGKVVLELSLEAFEDDFTGDADPHDLVARKNSGDGLKEYLEVAVIGAMKLGASVRIYDTQGREDLLKRARGIVEKLASDPGAKVKGALLEDRKSYPKDAVAVVLRYKGEKTDPRRDPLRTRYLNLEKISRADTGRDQKVLMMDLGRVTVLGVASASLEAEKTSEGRVVFRGIRSGFVNALKDTLGIGSGEAFGEAEINSIITGRDEGRRFAFKPMRIAYDRVFGLFGQMKRLIDQAA